MFTPSPTLLSKSSSPPPPRPEFNRRQRRGEELLILDLTAQNDLVEITERIVLTESPPSPRQSGNAGRRPGHWDFSIRSQFASDYPQTRWQFGTESGGGISVPRPAAQSSGRRPPRLAVCSVRRWLCCS